MSAIEKKDYSLCSAFVKTNGVSSTTNHLELLAISYGIVRSCPRTQAPIDCWTTLELLGSIVTPAFAECGRDAVDVFNIIHGLKEGDVASPLQAEYASVAIGRLWSKAFEGPSGYWHFIFRSVFGLIPADRSFLRGFLNEHDEGVHTRAFFLRCLNLIAIGISARKQPNSWIGMRITGPDFVDVDGYLPSGFDEKYPKPLFRHVKEDVLLRNEEANIDSAKRISVRLTYGESNETIGFATVVILQGTTGQYPEILELAKQVGGVTGKTVCSVFENADVVTLYPRVMRLLSTSEFDLTRAFVVERSYVKTEWRTRFLGQRVMWQVFNAAGDVDMVFIKPEVPYWGDVNSPIPDWELGALLAANLRLASYCVDGGGHHLINGVIGVDFKTYQSKSKIGTWDRVPQELEDLYRPD